MVEKSEQIVREAPEVEAYKLGFLLKFKTVFARMLRTNESDNTTCCGKCNA